MIAQRTRSMSIAAPTGSGMLGSFSQPTQSQQALANLQSVFANALAQRMGTA